MGFFAKTPAFVNHSGPIKFPAQIDNAGTANTSSLDFCLRQFVAPRFLANAFETHIPGNRVDIDFLYGAGRGPHAGTNLSPLKGRAGWYRG